jgi:prevent-host-death family protein
VKTRTMPAGLFKSKCLAVMDEVQAKCESVIITKHGKPVAKLVPVDPEQDDFYGFMKGKGKILGDIVSPIIPPEDWEID